jgi:hypothetical protein
MLTIWMSLSPALKLVVGMPLNFAVCERQLLQAVGVLNAVEQH